MVPCGYLNLTSKHTMRPHGLPTFILSTLFLGVLIFFLSSSTAFAAAPQTYQPLTAIPGVSPTGGTSLATYINSLFVLSLVIGAILAVVKIAVGGLQYMLSDVVTKKADARSSITGALLGLGIIIASVTILYTINKDLVNFNIFRNAGKAETGNPNSAGEWEERVKWTESPGLYIGLTDKVGTIKDKCAGEDNYSRATVGYDTFLNETVTCYTYVKKEATNASKKTGSCPDGEHLVLDLGSTSSGEDASAKYVCRPD